MSKVYTGTGRLLQEVKSLPMDEESLRDMERRVKLQPHFLGEPLVVAGEREDFPQVISAGEHDLLALDGMGRCVAVSLSHGIAGEGAETHALHLAAHVGELSPEDLGRIARSFIDRPANDAIRRHWSELGVEMSAEAVELGSLLASTFGRDAEDYASLINTAQRVIIAAEGFTSRMVEMVRWLNRCGVEIVGLRYRKYLVGGQEVFFAEQVVPTLDPAVDTANDRLPRAAADASEPWRTKGKAYHTEKLTPALAHTLEQILVLTRPATFTVNWSHKHYFWIRGARRNLRVRTYNREALELGFYNASPASVKDFLEKFGMDAFEPAVVGGYADSPFIAITSEHKLDSRWEKMLNEWLGGEP